MSSETLQATFVKDANTDRKSLKQRQQAEFYAMGIKESNTVKTKPPTVQGIKSTGQSHRS